MFTWRERIEPSGSAHGVEWAITDRIGGSSRREYAEFNLGDHVGDLPAAVETNRYRLAQELGLRSADLRFMDQQHGCGVASTEPARGGTGPEGSAAPTPPAADALVGGRTDEALVVLVADCVPVLLADRQRGLVAAVHAGRPGLLAGVVPAALEALRSRGAHDVEAVVGPSVCPRCYEVPAELRDEVAARTPVAASRSWTGTPAIDVAAGVVDQLNEDPRGVNLRWLPGCTRERADLYSYRRDGATGRFAGVVRLLPPQEVA